MVGFSLSETVTVKLQVSVFGVAAPSATVTFTVVTPLLNDVPLKVELIVPEVAQLNRYVILATVQLSTAETSQSVVFIVYEHNPASVDAGSPVRR